jgi:hypothetical protein
LLVALDPQLLNPLENSGTSGVQFAKQALSLLH